jgi:hypothetical protein
MRILRVDKNKFELEDGSVFPIIPPLYKDMSVEEFQEHYDYASEVVRSSKEIRGNNSNSEGLG